MQIYLDADGVLADFDRAGQRLWGMTPRAYEEKVGTQAFWRDLEAQGNFYLNLEPMEDGLRLLKSLPAPLRPVILTGAPRGSWAQDQKLRWRDKHLPGVPMVVCQAREKWKWCRPGDILVDDMLKYRLAWEVAGGFFIHYDSKDTNKAWDELSGHVRRHIYG